MRISRLFCGSISTAFFTGFDKKLKDGQPKSPRVDFMGSDGSLVDADGFSGLKIILSGPASRVVGYALTSWDEENRTPVIGCEFSTLSLF
jgi:5-oxoprolinase (ATP-hydrolysing)